MARLIGIVDSNGGVFREFMALLDIGSSGCPLAKLAGSAHRPNREWQAMVNRLTTDTGHSLELIYRNERTPVVRAASSGREPCILLEASDGSLSMIADWNDLELAKGDVNSFERIVRSKLLMY